MQAEPEPPATPDPELLIPEELETQSGPQDDHSTACLKINPIKVPANER